MTTRVNGYWSSAWGTERSYTAVGADRENSRSNATKALEGAPAF